MIVATSGNSMVKHSLNSYLNIRDRKKLTDDELDLLVKIKGKLSVHSVDDESAIGILKSLENRSGFSDSLKQRLTRFDKFLSSIGNRNDLIESVSNLGMLSKEELETLARESGDWTQVIKKLDKPEVKSETKKEETKIKSTPAKLVKSEPAQIPKINLGEIKPVTSDKSKSSHWDIQ
jgi:hypothetical protein